MRQQILENYIYFVFKLLIFFPLLRNTCGPLPTIPHYSFPNFVLPPVCLYQEDERPLSGTLQSSKFSVFSCNNHNKYSFFWYISLPLHLSVCLSVFRELQPQTFSHSRCWTCPYSWPRHRQFAAPDSSPLSSMSAVLYWMFAPPPNSTCVWVFSWSSRQVKEAGYRTSMFYRGADKSLARPTSRCILFDGENISFDASLVIYTWYK